MRTLIVEDNPVDELAVRTMLERPADDLEVEVRSCATVGDAIDLIGSGFVPDVALLDLNLPDGSGTDVVRAIAGSAGSAAIVVLTGTDDLLGAACIQAGAHQFLPKAGLDERTLRRTVDAARATESIQRELADALHDRDRAVNELEELLSIVAHDLRAPLRTARLFAGRMVDDASRRRMWTQRLDTSLGRMDSLVQALLEYGKLGRIEPTLVDVDLAELGEGLRLDLTADLGERIGVLRWGAAGHVRSDRRMLRQVLQNLICNSLRYTHPDRHPVIEVRSVELGALVGIEVADNGIGIEPEYWDLAFRPFERLTTEGEGLGLGLAAARRLVERNGGGMHIQSSSPDQGTVVQVLLPAARDSDVIELV
ncbi:MAG: hybrid sensor histidine kinase/response regulator [Actinomycetota bacterium]